MIDVEVKGDDAVLIRFERMPSAIEAQLVKATGRITLKLMRQSVQQKLSGQVLKVRTGTLRRSVTQSPRTFQIGRVIVGTVGVTDLTGPGGRAPVKYGAAHEYGGTLTVKAHLRLIKQAWGRPLKSPVSVQVRQHTRDLPERSFLRSALADLQSAGVIATEYQDAIQEATK